MRSSDAAINSFGLSSIRYESHPAFAGVQFDADPAITHLADELSAAIEATCRRAKLPSTDVQHRFKTQIAPAADRLFAALKEKNRHIAVFAEFADRLQRQVMMIVAEDIGVVADRAIHAYVDRSARADAVADSLWDRGHWFGRFDEAAINALDAAVASHKKMLWELHEGQHRIDRENLSINQWDGMTAEALNAVFNEPDIVAGISNYMGAPYAYSGCAFELSVPGTVWWSNRYGRNDESAEAAYFHLDQSSVFPKMLCYLSDVDEENGATSLLSVDLEHSNLSWTTGRALDGIHVDPNRGIDTNMAKMIVASDLGRRCFAALPKEMRCLGHFGNDLLAGSPEERYLLNNRTVMTGPKGTFVVFDGSRTGHRGGIVNARHRWAFQVIYAKRT